MCIRNVLSYRHDMSVDQNIPENAVELSEDFLNDMSIKVNSQTWQALTKRHVISKYRVPQHLTDVISV